MPAPAAPASQDSPDRRRRRLGHKTSTGGDSVIESLFRKFTLKSESSTTRKRADTIPDDLSVFHEVKGHYLPIHRKHPHWPEPLKQLAIGLKATYKLRKIDFSIREEVMLLHISESSDRIRAHGGQCFVYKDGSLVLFAGVISQGTLQRTRFFMKQLEGILKFLPDQREFPEEEQLLEQIVGVFNRLAPGDAIPSADNLKVVLKQLETKAHYPVAKGGVAAVAGAGAGAEVVAGGGHPHRRTTTRTVTRRCLPRSTGLTTSGTSSARSLPT